MAANRFKIPAGVDYIIIKHSFVGKEYELPAFKSGDGGLYRIPHKALSLLFKNMKERDPGLRMETGVIDGKFVGESSPRYALSACRITGGEKIRDTFFGETNVNIDSSPAEKKAPFAAATNIAQDKAIADFLGLQSRYFDKNGEPVLYDIDAREETETDENASGDASDEFVEDASARFTVEPAPVPEMVPTPVVEAPVSKPALTEAEEKEFEVTGETVLKVRVDGKDYCKIKDLKDGQLSFIAKNGSEAYRNQVTRYLELKRKKKGA